MTIVQSVNTNYEGNLDNSTLFGEYNMRSHKAAVRSRAIGKQGMEQHDPYKLSVLFLEHNGWWSAQCLEHDIAVQAKTLNALIYELDRTLVSHIAVALEAGREPFAGIEKAPNKFWQAFKKSQTRMERPSAGFTPGKLKKPIIKPDIRIAEQAA